MTTAYNRIAGQSAERLAALSDGVFAVAMTLLVLDLHAPAAEAVHSEHDLWRALLALAPRLLMYMMSFMTLGIFWVGQQTQLNHLQRSSRSLTWIHLAFLFVVTVTPFSTALLAEYTQYRLALLLYWLNIFLLGATLYWSWVCALGSGLVKEDMPLACFRRHQATHRDRAVVVCIRRVVVCVQSLLEHRVHRAGATELRDRPAYSRPLARVQPRCRFNRFCCGFGTSNSELPPPASHPCLLAFHPSRLSESPSSVYALLALSIDTGEHSTHDIRHFMRDAPLRSSSCLLAATCNHPSRKLHPTVRICGTSRSIPRSSRSGSTSNSTWRRNRLTNSSPSKGTAPSKTRWRHTTTRPEHLDTAGYQSGCDADCESRLAPSAIAPRRWSRK